MSVLCVKRNDNLFTRVNFFLNRLTDYRKQIAANTRRLVMSKHSQKVEESPLIGMREIPTVYDGGSVNEPRGKGNL